MLNNSNTAHMLQMSQLPSQPAGKYLEKAALKICQKRTQLQNQKCMQTKNSAVPQSHAYKKKTENRKSNT